MPRDERPFYAVDWPSTLVLAIFLSVLVTIGGVMFYRRQVSMFASPGRAITKEALDEMIAEQRAIDAAMFPNDPLPRSEGRESPAPPPL
jgi:hypothetical protein